MAINVQLEDENGMCMELLDDPLPPSLNLKNVANHRTAEFPLTEGIDPHGDTIFNGLQAGRLLKEWRILMELVDSSDWTAMKEAGRLIIACRDGVHLYLRFIGD